jgi:short-subunit dehydrogenase
MRNLAGRLAIVTGASGGIGVFVAKALAANSMNLVLAARSEKALEGVAQDIRRMGVQALAVPCDVSSHADRERLIRQTLSTFGRIDVLVNNAGIETYCPLEDLPIDQIHETIDVNLTSAIVLARMVLPAMLEARSGHIVNMSSTAGKHGPAYGAAYGASKAGLISLTETLRSEFKGRGVSASVICPGFTDDGGIYERMKAATGKGTPPQMGATSALKVAQAVVQAIQKDRPEMLVNWPPMRPVFVLAELWPKVGEWIIRKSSLRFLKRIATRRHSPPPERKAA